MKKILLLLFVACNSYGQQTLNFSAKLLKKDYQQYYKPIVEYSEREWKDDYTMVLHEINRQSKALVKMDTHIRRDTANIYYIDQLCDEYCDATPKKKKKQNRFEQVCDWSMIRYKYENWKAAKGAY